MNIATPLISAHRLERIWMLAQIEFKLRYYENKLGLLWALFKPLSQILQYYIVFEVILNQRIQHYVIYLWSGLFLWQFFGECTTGTIKLLQSKKYLYTNTNMEKIDIYLSSMISATLSLLINFLIFLIGAFVSGVIPTFYYAYFLLAVFNLFLMSMGLSLILSNLFLLFKDINQVWTIIMNFGFFLSPILYRGKIFDKKLPLLNYCNPIAGIVINTRNALFYGQPPDWSLMSFDYVYAIVLILLGLILLKRLAPRAAELL